MWLDGIRVLEAAFLLPVPYATQLLTDLGAEVVKVEQPDGGDPARGYPPFDEDGTSRLFASLNTDKRSVAIDLEVETGQDALANLLEDIDVVIEGFRPGVAADLGLDAESVHAVDQDIVHCSLSGYGQTGSRAAWPGHDLTFGAFTGLVDMTRSGPEEPPVIPGYPVGDMAGGLFAAMSVLGALLGEESRTTIDIGISDVLTSFSLPVAIEAFEGERPRPGRTILTGGEPWYDIYETADGRYVALAALERRFWRDFCIAVDRSDLIEMHGMTDHDELERLRVELEALFERRTAEEWMDLLGGDLPIERVQSVSEVLNHPHTRDRGLIDHGQVDRFLPPMRTSVPFAETSPPPRLGEHSRLELERVGVEPTELDELIAEGTLVDGA